MKYLVLILVIVQSYAAFPQQPKKEIRKGNREYEKGKYDEAEIQYRKALEKDPKNQKARIAR